MGSESMKEVCILGMGYIGLPTAAMFAANGIKVKGVDVIEKVCETINQGKIHIEEPYLGSIVQEAVSRGLLSVTVEIPKCSSFIIAVPTPITKEKKADLSYVKTAGEQIATVLEKGNLVIVESTVSPGCTEDVLVPILEKSGLKAGKDFYVAHCPERVLPGRIIHELQYNNRIIGGITPESAEKARDLYSAFVKGDMILTDAKTAELCKLMENTYRDVNIALANELAKICEQLGVNAWNVIQYANKHPRVHLHYPGPGVGGHCLAVDPWFIVEAAPDTARIIELARRVNDSMPMYMYEKVKALLPEGGKVIILGCTYKADVNDIRESPIMELVEILEGDARYIVEIIDPYIKQYNNDLYTAALNSDLVILGVNHQQFINIDFEILYRVMRGNSILDTRNYLNKREIVKNGLNYYLLGDAGCSLEDPVDEAAVTNETVIRTVTANPAVNT